MLSHIIYTLLNCEYVSLYHLWVVYETLNKLRKKKEENSEKLVFGLELGETFPIDKQRFPAKSTNNEPLSYWKEGVNAPFLLF